VFDRYLSEAEQKEAMAKLEAAQSKLETQAGQPLPAKMDESMVSARRRPIALDSPRMLCAHVQTTQERGAFSPRLWFLNTAS
jgi:hypothetical protein